MNKLLLNDNDDRMECPICTETFNRRHHKIVQCHHCSFQACHECVGTFLLEKMECMNCHKEWNYDFLCLQMTKTYLSTQYKENMKKKLMLDIEMDLASYQEIAALINQREEKKKQFDEVNNRLFFLENKMDNHVSIQVSFHNTSYQLYFKLEKDVPDNRIGSLIINHVEKLVNPPPAENDKLLMDIEKERLMKEKTYYKIMYSYAILNMNMFYTDKFLIAMSADLQRDLPLYEKVRKEYLDKIETSVVEYRQTHEQLKNFYTTLEYNEEQFTSLIENCRKISRSFWKYYFRVYPPTPEDFKLMEEDKVKYKETMNYYKPKLIQCVWDLEDVEEKTNSNLQYHYNLDDKQLYPLHQETTDMSSIVISKLETEETLWKNLIEKTKDEIQHLLPISNQLWGEYTDLKRQLRKVGNRKSSSTSIFSCPSSECMGKLKTNGCCGLCGKQYCVECGQEKFEQHLCKKEDVDTIRELQKNTRPCPRCHIPIYKMEGCDQMWCVQCHTTFSWKTGAITHGVVHNPHFYAFRRQAQETHRSLGDIPCGGLPNEIEMIGAIGRSSNPNMFDIWDYAVRISENLMPTVYRKFHNVRPLKYRRYSISYLRGKMDKKRLETLLYKNYMDEIRYLYYYNILETMVDNLAEYLRQFVRGLDTERECLEILKITEQEISNMNKKYNMKVRWHWS